MNDNIRIQEVDTPEPLCPQCGKEIRTVMAKKVESTFGVRFVYYCEHCRKVLGVSHRKGFWMG